MELIRITRENLEAEHICCAIANHSDIQTEKAVQIQSSSKGLIDMLPKDDLSKVLIEQAIDQLNSASKGEHFF